MAVALQPERLELNQISKIKLVLAKMTDSGCFAL